MNEPPRQFSETSCCRQPCTKGQPEPCWPQRPSLGEPIPQRPTLEQSWLWLQQQVWTLPLLDERSAEEILGFGA
jgi:hypothetical protein